jgi:hypothetical protein
VCAHRLIERNELFDKEKNFIKDDTLRLAVEIKFLKEEPKFGMEGLAFKEAQYFWEG